MSLKYTTFSSSSIRFFNRYKLLGPLGLHHPTPVAARFSQKTKTPISRHRLRIFSPDIFFIPGLKLSKTAQKVYSLPTDKETNSDANLPPLKSTTTLLGVTRNTYFNRKYSDLFDTAHIGRHLDLLRNIQQKRRNRAIQRR